MILFVCNEGWWRLGDHGMQPVLPFGQIDEAATVVWQPRDAVMGVAAFEGQSKYAAALIERRLHAAGDIETEAKVLVHRVRSAGKGYDALYSVAPLREWQRMSTWASAQPHGCLLFSAAALAWAHAGTTIGTVLQTGLGFAFMGEFGGRLLQANTVAFSDSVEDLAFASRALGERVAEALATMDGAALSRASSLGVTWVSLATMEREGLPQRLEEAFGAGSRLSVRSLNRPVGPARSPGVSALALMSARPPLALALNGPLERRLFGLERHRVSVAVGAFLLSVGLLAFAALRFGEAMTLRRELATAERPPASTERQRGQASVAPEAVSNLAAQLDFISTLAQLRSGIDVADLLESLRAASGSDLRILSVRSEEPKAEQQGVVTSFLVDGVIDERALGQGSQVLSAFSRAMVKAGYQATPVDVQSAAAASQLSSRLFSYRVHQAESGRESGSMPR
ncbi:MAG: hypothetical protein WA159_21035 [Variovorax sp.]